MITKNILIVSNAFYPQNSPRSFRTTELVKELSRQGHRVTVYTLKNKEVHPKIEEAYNITIRDLGKLKFKSVSVNHGNRYISLFKRAISRSLLMLAEYPDVELMYLVAKALKNENGYDLLISVAAPFPIHWGVAKAISKNRRLASTWVADCGDPYMGDRVDSFRKLFYFKYIEQWFCRKADFIAVPTKGSIDAYYPEFHPKIRVIPQGFNLEETKIFKGIVNNKVPTFAYAGGFIPGIRDPRELLEFLCSYEHPFKFLVYTSNTAMVQPYVNASGNRIEIKPNIPREELLYELSTMDFLVNFNNGTTVQTPSKLIDYAIAGRPVLSIDTGKLNPLHIKQFLEGDYGNQHRIENIESYNIKNVVEKFISLAEKQN
jgi:glycosyltransferase involved in cell wall biosynthesis